MIELKNITVAEYFALENKSEYDFFIQFGKMFQEHKDVYEIKDVMNLPFGTIKDIQDEIENNELDFSRKIYWLQKILNKSDKEIGRERLFDFTIGANFLFNEIINLIAIENETLSHELTVEEQQAGLNRFESLGIYLQLRKLAGGDVTKIEKIKQLPYYLCYTELYTMKQEYEFQNDLNRIYKNKHSD